MVKDIQTLVQVPEDVKGKPAMKKLIIMFLVIVLYTSIEAQSPFIFTDLEILTYVKNTGNAITFTSHSGNETYNYEVSDNQCISISYDGRYLAISSQLPTSLDIIYLPNQETILSTIWLPDWNPCVFTWTEDDLFVIIDLNQDRLFFEFKNSTLISIPIPTTELTYPNLPNFYPDSGENFIIPNPTNHSIYLYEKCPSGVINEGLFCGGGTSSQMVIYDADSQQTVGLLESALSTYYIRGYTVEVNTFTNQRYWSAPLASWSLDGRYLAYFNFVTGGTIPHNGRIVIYDLQTNTYLNDSMGLYLPNINRRLQWSVNNVLLMWNTGPFGDLYSYEFHDKLTLFRFFNADTQTYVEADKKFDVLDTRYLIRSNLAWFAPDGRAIAFIGKERVVPEQLPDFGSSPQRADLVYMSATTGESTVIDTDVTQIITWRSICDFTVSDTASLISTMQTEPYSVICLDENGQYDLTAPLPDVAGDITIIGNGATITMTGQNRILNVIYNQQWSRNGSLTLKNVTLSGGVADDGGAIYNAGDLTLENVTLENNTAVRGGAIYNVGSLVMNGGAIQNNSASEFGGGIYNIGDMQLDGVNIRDNTAPQGSGVYQGE